MAWGGVHVECPHTNLLILSLNPHDIKVMMVIITILWWVFIDGPRGTLLLFYISLCLVYS